MLSGKRKKSAVYTNRGTVCLIRIKVVKGHLSIDSGICICSPPSAGIL